jgi:putative Mg2+ transporter-C (MgtC) family protein
MNLCPLLTDTWRDQIHAPWFEIASVFVAVICGSIVGTEREKHEKPAGLRTLILVCLGSTGFTMASFIFAGANGDTGRVAAQIVTGIGFLGAGVIMHGRSTIVSGTTTAATIWVTAAIGMIAGTGYVGGALGLSVLVRVVLSGIRLYETHIAGERNEVQVEVQYEPKEGCTRVRLERVLVEYQVTAIQSEWLASEGGPDRLILRLRLRRLHLRQLLEEIVDVPGIKSIRETVISPKGKGQASPEVAKHP